MDETMADDIDRILHDIIKPQQDAAPVRLEPDDLVFINHILNSIVAGSKGAFVVLHPDDHMQYILLNADRKDCVRLLTIILERITR
jgi:hypothetical protein